jgi:hypothetical protein
MEDDLLYLRNPFLGLFADFFYWHNKTELISWSYISNRYILFFSWMTTFSYPIFSRALNYFYYCLKILSVGSIFSILLLQQKLHVRFYAVSTTFFPLDILYSVWVICNFVCFVYLLNGSTSTLDILRWGTAECFILVTVRILPQKHVSVIHLCIAAKLSVLVLRNS